AEEMSDATPPMVEVGASFKPTNSAAAFVAFDWPVSTLESSVLFVASREAAPAETTPSTCPPTPSPVCDVAVCDPVSRLLPLWRLTQPSPPVVHAAVMPAATVVVPSVLLRPANDARSLDAGAVRVSVSEVVEVY